MSRRQAWLRRGCAALAAAGMLLLAGCAYHWGTGLPESQRRIAVPPVVNQTAEAALSPLVRRALQERIANLPGLQLANPEGADAGLTIEVTLKSLTQDNLASAYIRERHDRNRDSDAYQTVLYRITLVAQWRAIPAQGGQEAIRTGIATGTADVPLMPDKETAIRSALRQAAIALAQDIAAAVAD